MTDSVADLNDIPAFLDRRAAKPLIYTYSMLNAYRNCGHAMYRRYIKKDQPYTETPQIKFGNDGHTAFEHRVGSRKPLTPPFDKWEHFAAALDGRGANVELKLAITSEGRATGFWDSDCWFRGKIDVTIRQKEKAYIRDWKFANSKYEDPFELETNALLLKAKYPELQIVKGDYVWMKENRVGQAFDLSAFGATWNEINRLVGLIEADRASGEFEKKKSGLCGWCTVEDCEHWHISERRK
jgi:hypothetical protein